MFCFLSCSCSIPHWFRPVPTSTGHRCKGRHYWQGNSAIAAPSAATSCFQPYATSCPARKFVVRSTKPSWRRSTGRAQRWEFWLRLPKDAPAATQKKKKKDGWGKVSSFVLYPELEHILYSYQQSWRIRQCQASMQECIKYNATYDIVHIYQFISCIKICPGGAFKGLFATVIFITFVSKGWPIKSWGSRTDMGRADMPYSDTTRPPDANCLMASNKKAYFWNPKFGTPNPSFTPRASSAILCFRPKYGRRRPHAIWAWKPLGTLLDFRIRVWWSGVTPAVPICNKACSRAVRITVHRFSGQTVKNMSGYSGPCRHKHVVPHPSATYIDGPRPQAPRTTNIFTDP